MSTEPLEATGSTAGLARDLAFTARAQRGLLFAEPAIVHRNTYTGRGILADNRSRESGARDARGYLPVEWWIMSTQEALNPEPIAGEGVTRLRLGSGGSCRLDRALLAAGELLLGEDAKRWPLVKLLDIGGDPVKPDFAGTTEVPPIPPHVHGGEIVAGKAHRPGKLEAYFFPPVDVAPYHADFGPVTTRLGIRPETTRAEFLAALREFGASDRMYRLLNPYPVRPYDGWTIRPGMVHAPGPWTTIEVQTPQDDFNLAAWQLGDRLEGERLAQARESLLLRGLADEEAFLAELVDWEGSSDPGFRERALRPAEVLASGPWGRRLRVFFDPFDGEMIELSSLATWRRPGGSHPLAGILWSGRGEVNRNPVSAEGRERKEFLVLPGETLEVVNRSEATLALLLFPPMTGAPG